MTSVSSPVGAVRELALKGCGRTTDAAVVLLRRRSNAVADRPAPGPAPAILLTVAAESQVWRRSATVAGERAPAGRIHAVLGASARTLCGLDHAELARFPYVDFVASSLERCEICRARGAALLH